MQFCKHANMTTTKVVIGARRPGATNREAFPC
jgi:hypothetical protein